MLLQEADNFLLGTGIVSRLYMGEILVWPVPSGNFWQFFDNPSCKILSGFRVVYQNGNVFANWGDGTSDPIISNTSYTHIFQPCDPTWNLGVLINEENQKFGFSVIGRGNFNIDWGDGISDQISFVGDGNFNSILHTYTETGLYTLKMNGTFLSQPTDLAIPPGVSFGTVVENGQISIDIPKRLVSTSVIPNMPNMRYLDFYRCENLESIPLGLLSKNNLVNSNQNVTIGMFERCYGLKSVPANLFDSVPPDWNPSFLFKDCFSIENIPTGLFDRLTLSPNFIEVFAGCSGLKEVPSNLFFYNTGIRRMDNIFGNSIRYDSVLPIPLPVKLSTSSYSNLLINLNSNLAQRNTGVVFGGGNSQYTTIGEVARQSLITNKNWIFTDGGIDTDIVFSDWNIGIQIPTESQQFGLQINGTNPNIIVNWGNGSPIQTINTQGNFQVPYTLTGNYTIRLNGSLGNNGNIRLGITSGQSSFVRSVSTIPRITGLNSMFESFKNCSNLVSLPENLFSNNTGIINFENCFQNCSSLNQVPTNIFSNNISANNFRQCFSGVTLPTRIYSNILRNLSSNRNLRPNNVPFDGGNSKYNIPAQDARQALQNKGWVFTDSGLDLDFPVDTWELEYEGSFVSVWIAGSNPNITIDYGDGTVETILAPINNKPHYYPTSGTYIINIEGSFASGGNIWISPEAGFFKNTSIIPYISGLSSFNNTFSRATFKSVPENLFFYNPQVTQFRNTFTYSSLESIPTGIFRNNTGIIELSSTFQGCEITSVPSGLFDKLSGLKSIDRIFNECNRLTNISTGLFDKNLQLESTYQAFSYAPSLYSLPTGIFEKNINIINFDGFCQQSNLTIENYSNIIKNIASNANQRPNNVGWNAAGCDFLNKTEINPFNFITYDSSAVSAVQTLGGKNWTRISGLVYDPRFFYLALNNYDNRFGENGPSTRFRVFLSGTNPRLTIDWDDGNSPVTYTTPGNYFKDYPSSTNIDTTTYYRLIKVSGSLGNSGILKFNERINPDDFTNPNKPFMEITAISTLPFISGLTTSPSFAFNQITQFPYELFKRNPQIRNINRLGGTFLRAITNDLFSYSTGTLNIDEVFLNCTNINYIPENLFDKNTGITSFRSVFYNCILIDSIPSGLFKTHLNAINFDYTFQNLGIGKYGFHPLRKVDIPENLFSNNINAESFQSTFNRCNLDSIPSGLFKNNTKVENFISTFSDTSIKTIPYNLFYNQTGVKRFIGTFSSCTNLNSIPTGLFSNNTEVNNFGGCFGGCSSLLFIPTGLFDNNLKVEQFNSTFFNCTSLINIPTGLFKNNILAFDFDNIFTTSSNVLNENDILIPENLFENNILLGSSIISQLNIGLDRAGDRSYHKSSRILNNLYKNYILRPSNVNYGYDITPIASDARNTFLTKNWTIGSVRLDSDKWAISISPNSDAILQNQYNIELQGNGINITIDWGDGVIETFTTGGIKQHTYIGISIYSIRIDGSFTDNGFIRLAEITSQFLPSMRTRSVSTMPFIPGLKGINFSSTSITSIGKSLFVNNPQINNVAGCFFGCTSLTTIPNKLFGSLNDVISFENCFANCTALNKVNQNVFIGNLSANNYVNCFANVTLNASSYSRVLQDLALGANYRPNGVTFNGGNSKYNANAIIARNKLLDKGWDITDGGWSGQ